MSQVKLTRDTIERRLMDNLRKENMTMSFTNSRDAQTSSLQLGNLMNDAPENMTFTQRLRYTFVVTVLQKINLTSYRRLRHAYAVIGETQTTIIKLLQERDETARLLRTVAADRDRLSTQMPADKYELARLTNTLKTTLSERDQLMARSAVQEYKAELLRNDLESLRTAHTQLQQQYDQAVRNVTFSESRSGEGKQDTEETVTLPLTIKADAVVPHDTDVDRYLKEWGLISDENETDALYYVLETSLRGSEEDIKNRQREYLPHLTIVDPALPVVDLGCGRGEFLELMREQGIRALGIDTNSKNIEELNHKGLEVYQQDAVAYLESAAPESLAAVTAFQVIEHVPNDYLRKLIKLAHQKLAPGGFILLETVNPYCLDTYRTFYLDPTHQNPVPLDLLSILFRFYGFADTQVFFQSPIKPKVTISQRQVLTSLYQGYALLATKPATLPDQAL